MSAPSVQLPRTLSRPQFSEVSRDLIMAVAPELANVPPEYIRRGLRAKAPQCVIHLSWSRSKSLTRLHTGCSQVSPVCRRRTCPLQCQNLKCPTRFRFHFVHRQPNPPIPPIFWLLLLQNLPQTNTLTSSLYTASALHRNAQHCLDCPLRAGHRVGVFTSPCYPSISLLPPHSK